jgi:hypothetical protein
LSISLKQERLLLAIGVSKLSDTMPPVFPWAFGNQHTNFDIGTYSPIRRLVNGQLTAECLGRILKFAFLLVLGATLLPARVLADDEIPPVVGGRTWIQHLVEQAQQRHPEIESIVVTGLRGGMQPYVILASSLDAGSVFRNVPEPIVKTDAAPAKDGRQFVVHEDFLGSTDHILGTIEIRFPYGHGQTADRLEAIAYAVQQEIKRVMLSAKNAIDPYPYDTRFSPDTYAQGITEQILRNHPELVVVMLHATPPGQTTNVVIGSNIGRFGKPADEDDLRIIEQGKTNLEVAGEGDRFEVALPLLDVNGKQVGALGLVFPLHPGDDKDALHARGRAIRDELAKLIPNNAALFEPWCMARPPDLG